MNGHTVRRGERGRRLHGTRVAACAFVQFGLWLSSEEHDPRTLVDMAERAEASGLSYVQISDHFHPWIDRQGQSPFVWSVIGAIGARTTRIQVGTGVTCPIIRIHPVIVAHAAATAAVMLEGRFFLGVGTGENLNEHVVGQGWPPIEVRREMLEEAIDVLRLLFRGAERTFRGRFFTVEDARLYTLPKEAPPIYVAASGPQSAELAAGSGDGLISTSPDRELVARYERAGGKGKPKFIEVRMCWGRDPNAARKLVHEIWPTAGLGGQLGQDLRRPADFEAAVEPFTADDTASEVPVGLDPEPYVKAIRECADAGFDHIALHQVGPDQKGFLEFWERELRPAVERTTPSRAR
jgi:G6PDH family F420-dependent oxidoreductase